MHRWFRTEESVLQDRPNVVKLLGEDAILSGGNFVSNRQLPIIRLVKL